MSLHTQAGAGRMKLLLAVDESPFADLAIDFLLRHCASGYVEVCVLHVTEWSKGLPMSLAFGEGPTAVDDLLNYRGARRRQAQAVVDRVVGRLGTAGFSVTSELVEGDARAAIVTAARDWRADLIVLGSHGRTGLTRLMLGSVAENVLRHAPCSVLIVRHDPATGVAASSALPGGVAERRPLKVLVAVDGSEWTATVRDAITLGFVQEHMTARVLHVDEWSFNPPAPELVAAYSRRRHDGQLLVDDVTRHLRATGINAEGVVVQGDARQVIPDQAREWGADMIALGSHGRSGVERLLVGSVSEAVARHAHCPVYVVRASARP